VQAIEMVEAQPGQFIEETDEMREAREAAERAQRQLEARVQALALGKEREAMDLVARRIHTEERWYDDLRQYYGRYDATTEKNLRDEKKSRVYVRKTGAKTRTWEARLVDLLFPTDDRNWGIGPTPVPELVNEMRQVPPPATDGQPIDPKDQERRDRAAAAQATMEDAKRRAEAMQAEMEDQLRECLYNHACREAIHDQVLLGTGIIKGPVIDARLRSRWAQDKGQGKFARHTIPDPRPSYTRVDPWNFFPDPNCGNDIRNAEFTFERHLLNGKQLRNWAKKQGYNPDAIRRVLDQGPRASIPTYVEVVSTIINGVSANIEKRFEVWEYRGPLSAAEMMDLFAVNEDERGVKQYAEIDPLDDVQVSLYVCQGEVMKFGIHPLDSEECIYSVAPFVKDESSIWGWGVPALMRDSQAALNAAWRMMLDNGDLASGPQVVINRKRLSPADGVWEIRGRKVWLDNGEGTDNRAAFETYDIGSRQGELANVINFASTFADEETGLPLVAQGEQGSTPQQTASGMAMLMNSANVIFRHVVKNYDDDITIPNIRRLYDFNMQFSRREDIKGDMNVDARGSSVLLVREIQSQNLILAATQFTAHPVLGKFVKPAAILRKTFQSMMLPADELVMTDDEIADAEARAAENPPPPDPEMLKLEQQMQMAQMKFQHDKELAMLQRDTEMIRMANARDMDLMKLQAMMAESDKARTSAERIQAVEVAVKDRDARRKMAAGKDPETATGTRFGGTI